uniref:Uncharacterized protein n=1 Tax=Lactuca sativa TaxID=4236 RepID=A0A9R1UJJ4_LACSA|nr:hypothetical protein LSAT_V11C900497450 [Lactuca sativa]
MIEIVANRLRSMVVAEVPKLASAAEYFFKMGVEGKNFKFIFISLIIDIILSCCCCKILNFFFRCYIFFQKKINKGKLINMNIEMLTIMMMQLAVLAGDFLLFRSCITLASLKNTEVSTIPFH